MSIFRRKKKSTGLERLTTEDKAEMYERLRPVIYELLTTVRRHEEQDKRDLDVVIKEEDVVDNEVDIVRNDTTDCIDLGNVQFLHYNFVKDWKCSATLNVQLIGSKIRLDYNKDAVWKPKKHKGGLLCCNFWVIFYHGGVWKASTFEFGRPNQIVKEKSSVAGKKFGNKKWADWKPSKGEVLYFMVSGLCRGGHKNVQERSNIVKVVWK